MNIPECFTGAEARLHADATELTGLDDFGPTAEYLPGLTQLLTALDHGPRFTPLGRQFCYGSLVGVLAARLTTEQGWKQRPQCLETPIRRPLIITGVPRTGTTVLHKLLSMDTQFQGLERWLTASPIPRPPRDTWENHPAYRAMQAGLKHFFELSPALKAAHNMEADEVDECIEVLKQNFCSNYFGSTLDVPEYDRWWRQQDERPSYQRYADVLRLIGADAPGQRWLLKNPGHVHELDALLEVFPDACIVQTHRDPVKALPSICSTLLLARQMSEGQDADSKTIGAREMDYWGEAVQRAMAVRARAPGNFFDVRHKDFHADPMGVVTRIYERFDLALSEETKLRMRDYLRDNPEGKHGSHTYTLEQFGLDAQQIRGRFGEYIERYQLQ